MVHRISVKNKPQEFLLWLDRLIAMGFSCEIIVEDYQIERIYVKEAGDGDWKDIAHGRVIMSSEFSYKMKTYRPRIVDGKFTYNYNESNKKE